MIGGTIFKVAVVQSSDSRVSSTECPHRGTVVQAPPTTFSYETRLVGGRGEDRNSHPGTLVVIRLRIAYVSKMVGGFEVPSVLKCDRSFVPNEREAWYIR